MNLAQPFHWIASDGWGKQQKLVESLEEVAEGAITVELQSENIPGFDHYMMTLTPESNQRNPWFDEYWQDTFGCVLAQYAGLTADPLVEICDSRLRLSEKVGYEQESKVQFVVDAVYAFALALHNLHRDLCGHWESVSPAMASYDGADFYRNYLLNVSFLGK